MIHILNKSTLTCVAFTGCALSSTFAQSVRWDGSTDGDFTDGTNWDSGVAPSGTDEAFIRDTTNANPVFLNAGDYTFSRLSMGTGSNASDVWQLNINGGSINLTGNNNNIGQQAAGTVNLNIQGGTFTSLDKITAGGSGGDTFINLSSGSMTTENVDFGESTGNATFNLSGDTAVTTAVGEDWTFGANGTLEFDLTTTGVKTLSLDELTAADGTLAVDLTGYTGAATTITLADVTGGAGIVSAFGTVNVTEGAYAGSFVTQDAVNNVITLTIVPEPGTYALLGGLLALSYVMVRRRS